MGYKDQFKVGDLISSDNDINRAAHNLNLLEVIGYKNVCNVFHIKLKSCRTGLTTDYPAMYAEHNFTNFGKKQVVELLWIKK